jgi:excisionase family DNA binding protein
MTLDEARQLPPVLSVAEAGQVLGLRRSASYAAARRGELPTIRFGRRVLVPTGQLLALLGLEHPHVLQRQNRSTRPGPA